MRPLIVGMDAALVAFCLYCLLNPGFHQYFLHKNSINGLFHDKHKDWYWFTLTVLICITYFVSKSGYAAFHAPELFSKHRYGHARLCQELDYRNEYGIE